MWKKDSRWEFYEFRAKNCQHKEKMDAFLVKQICSLPHAHTTKYWFSQYGSFSPISFPEFRL